MSLLWPEDAGGKRGRRWRPNPTPNIPKTGWTFREHFPDLSGAKVICFDVETKDPEIDDFGPGWGRGRGHIIGVALATDDGFRNYYPIRHAGYRNHDPEKVLRYCREQLGRENQPKLGHNVIYDLGWLEHEGVKIRGDIHDTWTAEKLLDHAASASLESLGQRYLGEGKESTELYEWAWQAWGKNGKIGANDKRKNSMRNLWRTPPELVGFYAESDVVLPIDIARHQFAELEREGLWDVYRLECDLIPILVQMRLLGVSVDLDAAEQARDQFLATAHGLQLEINKIAGREVNTGSPVDMEKLFTKLKLDFNRTDNGKMSLKGEFMKSVEHPIGGMVVELEELKKYVSTFIENAILKSNVGGKVFCEFNPLRAVTGRMSSSSPNLQQVPSRNALAKAVRSIFVPDKGHDHWRKYDYSSIESRILAHDAVGRGAKELRKEYKKNPLTDYHVFAQNMIHSVTGIMLERKPTKTINFGIIYGMMIDKLARSLGISYSEAEDLFNTYHDGLPYVRETMNHYSSIAENTGEIRTVLNRKSVFDKWEPKYTPRGAPKPKPVSYGKALREWGPNIVRAFSYKALNYRIQGSAADLMKSAIVKCWKDGVFDEIGFPRMIIHDELTYSVPHRGLDDGFRHMKWIMENAIKFRVPIRVEGEAGPNWMETEKIVD